MVIANSKRTPINYLRGKKIVLLAGHLGKDSGATWGELVEGDITAEVAHNLRWILGACGAETWVLGGPLKTRTKLINTLKPDVALSVHANAFVNSQAHGIEVLYYQDSHKQLAKDLLAGLKSIVPIKVRRTKKRKNLWVLKETAPQIPIALVELGFITSLEDSQYLDDSFDLILASIGIMLGLNEFLKRGDKNV